MIKMTEDQKRIENAIGQLHNLDQLNEVLTLPKRYRYSAAQQILSDADFLLYQNINGERKSLNKNISDVATIFENAFSKYVYNTTDFGRYQSTHRGDNVLPSKCRIRREYGERYKSKYTSTDLYSDYFFAVAHNELIFRVKHPDWTKPKTIRPHKLSNLMDGRFAIYEQHLNPSPIWEDERFKRLGFSFNHGENAIVTSEGFVYHIEQTDNWTGFNSTLHNVCGSAALRLKYQKDHKMFKKAIQDDTLMVTRQNSIEAGNCPIGTDNFINSHDYEKEEVSATQLWKVRKDTYVERAIMNAAQNNY